jgi:hypothetical protein
MKVKTNAELLQLWKTFCETNVTALNGLLEKLPESLRAEFQSLRDSLNRQLKDLPPLDQIPAAQEANWALATFGDAMVRMQEYASNLIERISGLQKEMAAKALSLNGFEEKVNKGELVDKNKVKELCDLARNEALGALRPEICATRKSAIELAGLPVPGEDILNLPADQYNTRVTNAKENARRLGEKGIKVGGRGDLLAKQMIWLGATEFAGQLTMLEDVLGATRSGHHVDPLLGNKGNDNDNKVPDITLA